MGLSRTLYVGQQASITTSDGSVYYLPVSSANCELTNPIEAVSAMGHLGSLATAQTNLSTCRANIKCYVGTGANGSGLTSACLNQFTGDAVQGKLDVIEVSPYGFRMSGILTSVGVDISMGQFATADVVFAGVGQPYFSPVGQTIGEQANMPSVLAPVTSPLCSGSITSGCASSFKFNLDMPIDNLSCLGEAPNVVQNVGMQSCVYTKPPYKATISVEGYGVDVSISQRAQLNSIISGLYILGPLELSLPRPKITALSFNNAVGAAGASFSYTIEDTTALFGSSYSNMVLVSVTFNPEDPNNTSGISFIGPTEALDNLGNGNAYNQMDLYTYPYNSGNHVHVVISYNAYGSPDSSIVIESVDGGYNPNSDFVYSEAGLGGNTITVDFVATQDGMIHIAGTTTNLSNSISYDWTISPT